MNSIATLTAQLLREKNFLGSILDFPAQLKIVPHCTPEHFTDVNYRNIFKAIKNIPSTVNITIAQVILELEHINHDEARPVLMSIIDGGYLTVNIVNVFEDLHEAYKKRKALELTELLKKDLNSSKPLQTALTDFNYNTQSLKSDFNKFAPTEILLNSEFEAAAELCYYQNELILRKGNITLLQAPEGTGKSRVMSAIVASNYAAKDVDNLGFNLCNSDNEIILHIDTEQEKTEVLSSMKRIVKRSESKDIADGNRIKNYNLQSFVTIPTIAEKKNWLFNSIEHHGEKLGIVILDGITDFVTDINDLSESQDLLSRLISYMNIYDFGIIATIHTNTNNDGSGKPRGHIGSELKRKAGSNLAIVKTKLTHEFNKQYGEELVKRVVCLKNRFSTDDISSHFAWNGEKRMFTTCELESIDPSSRKRISYESKIEILMNEILKSTEQLAHSELCERIMSFTEKSKRTAERNIKTAVNNNVIVKSESELYSLRESKLFD